MFDALDYYLKFEPARNINNTINDWRVSYQNDEFSFNLAGCPKDAIDVEIDEGKLVVSAEWDNKKFYKTISLDYSVDYDKCVCDYKEGLLTVKAPKKSDKKTILVR